MIRYKEGSTVDVVGKAARRGERRLVDSCFECSPPMFLGQRSEPCATEFGEEGFGGTRERDEAMDIVEERMAELSSSSLRRACDIPP